MNFNIEEKARERTVYHYHYIVYSFQAMTRRISFNLFKRFRNFCLSQRETKYSFKRDL